MGPYAHCNGPLLNKGLYIDDLSALVNFVALHILIIVFIAFLVLVVLCIFCIFRIFVFLCVVHSSFFCIFVFFVFFVSSYFSYFCKVMHLMRVLQWLCMFLYSSYFWCSIFRIFDEFFVFSFPGLMHQVHASRSINISSTTDHYDHAISKRC